MGRSLLYEYARLINQHDCISGGYEIQDIQKRALRRWRVYSEVSGANSVEWSLRVV